MTELEIYDMPTAVKCFGSESVVREALKTYLAEVTGMLDKVADALQRDDREALGKGAHWLRGGLSYLHAPRVRLACKLFDNLVVEEASQAKIQESFDQLQVETQKLSAHVEEMFKS